jgi:hypothetical protein
MRFSILIDFKKLIARGEVIDNDRNKKRIQIMNDLRGLNFKRKEEVENEIS